MPHYLLMFWKKNIHRICLVCAFLGEMRIIGETSFSLEAFCKSPEIFRESNKSGDKRTSLFDSFFLLFIFYFFLPLSFCFVKFIFYRFSRASCKKLKLLASARSWARTLFRTLVMWPKIELLISPLILSISSLNLAGS